jgi:hypothetical protein
VTSLLKVDVEKRETRERLVRAVNNWIRLQGKLQAVEEPVEFLCECGGADCYLTLELTVAEYDDLPAMPDRLLLAREHLGPLDGHYVFGEQEHYVVLAPSE